MTESEPPKRDAGGESLRHDEADVDLEPMGDDDEFTDPADRPVTADQELQDDIDPEAVADEAVADEVAAYEQDD